MNKTQNQIAIDTQIEKKAAQIIHDNIWAGLEYGQVKLEHVPECAEKLREYFQSIYLTDPTALPD